MCKYASVSSLMYALTLQTFIECPFDAEYY